MASVYPSGLDSLNTGHQDSVGEIIHAADINNLADAVNKVEAELGTLPKGQFSSVSAKLGALFYGQVTSTQRDAITNGNRPTGLIVFNTTTNRYEFNAGTQTTPTWSPVGPAGPWGTTDLIDGAVTTAKLASQAVTAATIANSTITDTQVNTLSPGKVTGTAVITSDLRLIPTAVILPYGASGAPTGWLLCDGSAVSRSTYSALFSSVGTTYGTGDGSTTFNVPDMRGRVPAGYAASGGHADVNALGKNDGIGAANRRPKHQTTVTDPGHKHGLTVFTGPIGSINGIDGLVTDVGMTGATPQYNTTSDTTRIASGTTGITAGTGNVNDSLDAPSYLVVNYIIKT